MTFKVGDYVKLKEWDLKDKIGIVVGVGSTVYVKVGEAYFYIERRNLEIYNFSNLERVIYGIE